CRKGFVRLERFLLFQGRAEKSRRLQNGIQEVARSIRVSSTNKIRLHFRPRTSSDSRIARIRSASVKAWVLEISMLRQIRSAG
ncbi:MAG: hypothetical protein WB999_14465, partial [Candidatus Binataceae bacterium]